MHIDSLKKTPLLKYQLFWFLLLFIAINATLLPMRSAHAGAFVMPIRTYIDGQSRTHAVQEIISWTEDSGLINPCYGQSVCYIGPDVLYSNHPPGMYGSCIDARSCLEISNYRTRVEVANAYKMRFGIPYQSDFPLQSSDATCVGLFYITHEPVLPPAGTDATQWPGSTCGKLPPANQFCSISLPSYVDHGSINNANLNGQVKSVSGTINCTQSASLNIYARSTTGERYVYLNSNSAFYSRPLINNQDGWNGVNIPVSGSNMNNPFTFTSELHTTSNTITPGYYTGNSIVIISFN